MGLEIADGLMILFVVGVVAGIVAVIRYSKNTTCGHED